MVSMSIWSAILALPLLAAPVFADNGSDCVRTYTVQQGDICDSISSANNASTYQLAAINPGTIDSNCDNLALGESLCLGTSGNDCQNVYVVKLGDTCDSISSAYGINSSMLYTNNPNIDQACSNIYIGEVLCVANTMLVPPPPSSGIPATTIPSTAMNPTATPSGSAPPNATPTDNGNGGNGSDNGGGDGSDDGSDDGDDDDLPYCDELDD